jgi:hypothetical protein
MAPVSHRNAAPRKLYSDPGFRLASPLSAADVGRDPATLPAPTKALGDTTQDLVYKPLTACRIVDTRAAGGPIAANTSRAFLAVAINAGANFSPQGGAGTSCGTENAGASAVMLNVTVLTPANAGSATVYKSGTSRPPTSSILYAAGAVQSSQVVVGIPNPLAITDFVIYTQASADFTVDIVGLFTTPAATPLQCTQTAIQSFNIAANATTFFDNPACPTDYAPIVPYCFSSAAGVHSKGSGVNSNLAGLQTFCAWQNTTGTTQQVLGGTVCCRIPGR